MRGLLLATWLAVLAQPPAARSASSLAGSGGAAVVRLPAALSASSLAGSGDASVVRLASARRGLHVVPFPGTPDASPISPVIFSSIRPSDVSSITVVGSRTGVHPGRLISLPDGGGTAFIPDVRFAGGERVDVTAALRSAQAGAASGAPGATRLSFSFTVERPVSTARSSPSNPAPSATQASATGRPAYRRGRLRFRSQPNFYPPEVNMTSDTDLQSGDIFLTPHDGGQNGPMILNSGGQLVWFRPLTGQGAFNLEVQHYRGQPVLTWWQGNTFHGQGNGADVILNRFYGTVAVLHAGDGYVSDLHEFQITRQGTALIDAYVLVPYNLTSVGGPANGKVWDCVIQELDIKTGRVLWEWHALGHVPVSDSHAVLHPGRAYDYFHLNAIEQLPDGNLLVSARNMWAIYKINGVTGHVMWELGGRHSSFHMAPGTNFEWQHDAHLSGGDTLTLFDDASFPQEERESSAKTLKVNLQARTAVLEHRYTHYPPLLAGAEGSEQILPNGNVFVGWGTASYFSEYTSSGHLVFNGVFPAATNSYRAYRFNWDGQPVGRPSISLSPESNGYVNVYASWNGATQVASWRVFGGPTPGSVAELETAPKTSFETVITLGSEPRYVAVQALSASGRVLGTSQVHSDPSHVALFGADTFARDSDGSGNVAVGCFTGRECHLTVQISAGSPLLAHAGPRAVRPGTGALIPFRLSPSGRRELVHSAPGGLGVQVTVHDSSSGERASRSMVIFPYSTNGPGPPRRTVPSRTIRIVGTTGFVSGAGVGQLVAACYATSSTCAASATIASGGQVIATTPPEQLGAEELGDIYFKLTPTGLAMLRSAGGNQLPAQILLSNGNDTARGQIALVRYQ